MTPAHGPADTHALRKARGAFFTPAPLCRHLAEWAIRAPGDRVLEPSCGEAAFLVAAAARLTALGAPATGRRLAGIELHAASARHARAVLAAAGASAEIRTADLFTVTPEPRFDAVIGNPPYVRYQEFSGESRARAREAALAAGVRLSALASSWAAFTVHASLFLRPGGRLGLVLPAELLSVNYAAEVRRWLMARFGRVRLVLFSERVFPGVQEEVVLLMAEGRGPTDRCELHQVRDLDDLLAEDVSVSSWRPADPAGKWTRALLGDDALRAYNAVAGTAGFGPLQAWGETTLGAVTGNNRFFALPARQVRDLGLPPEDLLRISPPGSRHLRGTGFGDEDWARLEAAGSAVWLFRPAGEPSAAAARRIARGEAEGVDRAYKCRVRSPWWRTPVPPPADLLVTCMNADTPRLVANRAGAHHLNSVHGLYVPSVLRALAQDGLAVAALNSMTLLSAETVGRAYGGGVLKLEPREADELIVPSPALVAERAGELAAVRPEVDRALAAGALLDAVAAVDRVVLDRALGVPAGRVDALRQAREVLATRRRARGRRRTTRP